VSGGEDTLAHKISDAALPYPPPSAGDVVAPVMCVSVRVSVCVCVCLCVCLCLCVCPHPPLSTGTTVEP
jgi:hypothetical protein